MKKYITGIAVALTLISTATFAQNINPSQVPSVVANSFKKEFPKAADIEWELDGANYTVEFEISWFTDHEIWYDAKGNMLKHVEEISKGDLPKAVTDAIKADFKELKIEDAKKINESGKVSYSVELENFTEEWKVIFSSTGEVIQKLNN